MYSNFFTDSYGSNAVEKYDEQCAFVNTILGDVVDKWSSSTIRSLFNTPEMLFKFVGVIPQQSPYPPPQTIYEINPTAEQTNSRKLFYTSLQKIMVVFRRSKVPSSLQVIHCI